MALLKYCNRNGCNKLVPQGVRYCKAHTVNKTAENRERHKEYDAHCRNQTAKAFYNSSEWKATRARVLARDTGIDIYLYITEGRVVPADTVHHIVELMEDYSKRCDLDNLISISEATHSMISKAYKDEIKKAQMQQTLRECISEYKKKACGVGGAKKFRAVPTKTAAPLNSRKNSLNEIFLERGLQDNGKTKRTG